MCYCDALRGKTPEKGSTVRQIHASQPAASGPQKGPKMTSKEQMFWQDNYYMNVYDVVDPSNGEHASITHKAAASGLAQPASMQS